MGIGGMGYGERVAEPIEEMAYVIAETVEDLGKKQSEQGLEKKLCKHSIGLGPDAEQAGDEIARAAANIKEIFGLSGMYMMMPPLPKKDDKPRES